MRWDSHHGGGARAAVLTGVDTGGDMSAADRGIFSAADEDCLDLKKWLTRAR